MRGPTASIPILLAILVGTPALAHGPADWINQGKFANPLGGELCCGEGDCGVLVYGHVAAFDDGYHVDATFRIGDGPGATDLSVVETVPYSQAMPSPDGRFWRCKKPNGERRCFFAPPPGM